MRQFAFVVGAALFVVSCVPKKKFDTLVSERDLIQSELAETRGELAKATEDAQAWEGEAGNLNQDLEAEKAKVAALTKGLNQTSQELSTVSTRQAQLQDQYAKLQQTVADQEKRKAVAEARVAEYWSLRSKLGVTSYAGKPQATIEDGRILVVLPADSLFVNNTASLTTAGVATIQEAARTLATLEPKPRFVVETYTDSSSPVGSGYASNWDLGAARALAITQVMTVRKGGPLAQNRVSAQTFGDSSPRASNETVEGRALNRRAYIVVLPNNSQLPGYAELKAASEAVSTVKFDVQGRAIVPPDTSVTAPANQGPPPAGPGSAPPPPPSSVAPAPMEDTPAEPGMVPPPTPPLSPPPTIEAPPAPSAAAVENPNRRSLIPLRAAPPPAPARQAAAPGKLPRFLKPTKSAKKK